MKGLLSNISEAMNKTFVGNYVFSHEELAQIYDFTSRLLRDYNSGRGNSISQEHDQLMFVAMVNAVKTWKSDEDTLWDCICKKLIGTSRSQKIYNYLTDVIDRLSRQCKIMCLSGCKKRYYATILVHAFAPLNSTESFLDLCWNLYSVDMNFTYTKNDEMFVLVAEELKRIFSNEKSLEEDLKLGSGVYSLRAGIKGMAIDIPEEMVRYIENTIALLDRVFGGEILDSNLYYNTIVRDWWVKKEKNFGVAEPKRKVSERAITDYSTIRPKYSYNGKQAVLTIPCIRLKNNFYDRPILNVYRNGELVDRREMDTFGSGLTMATKEQFLYADNLVFEDGVIDCTLEIVHCDEIIYNSKKSLFREYILFKDHREILQEECMPGNYILFAPKFEDRFFEYPESIKRVPNEPNLYNIQSQEGERLQTVRRTVFFVFEKQEYNIRIIADRKNNAKFIHNGEEFIVIDGELKIVVKADVDITKYGIRYESSDFKLKDFTCDENGEYRTFFITELLNVCEPQKINLFSYADNKVEASYNVVKFNSISITYDKKLYFDEEDRGTVRFHTEKYDKSVSFDINQGDIIIPFDDGDVVLSPPVLRWKFGDGDFSMHYGRDLWYKKYSNSAELVIDLPTEMGYQVFLNNNFTLCESTSFHSFKLGETVWSMLQGNSNEIVVSIKIEDVGVLPILTVCIKEKLKFSPFVINRKEMLWDVSKTFVGDSTPKFRVSFCENDKVKHNFDIDENLDENYKSRYFSLSDLEIGIYNVTVDLMKQAGFIEKPIRLFEQRVALGDINKIRFKGKYLRFEKVMLMGKTSYTEIWPFYVDHLWYIGEIGGCCYYTGSAYFINRYGRRIYLNTMENSDGTCDKINPIRIELRSENSCFIVAGANPGDIYDFLGEFTLDSSNRISNYDTESNGNKTRGIDYFLFDTEEVK